MKWFEPNTLPMSSRHPARHCRKSSNLEECRRLSWLNGPGDRRRRSTKSSKERPPSRPRPQFSLSESSEFQPSSGTTESVSTENLSVVPELGWNSEDSLKLNCGLGRDGGLSFDDFVDRLLRSPGPFSQLSLRHSSRFEDFLQCLAGWRDDIGSVLGSNHFIHEYL